MLNANEVNAIENNLKDVFPEAAFKKLRKLKTADDEYSALSFNVHSIETEHVSPRDQLTVIAEIGKKHNVIIKRSGTGLLIIIS